MLIELGCSEVRIKTPDGFKPSFYGLENLELRPSFERRLRSYMEEILGGHNG
jgi:hypothetical protein